jgi:hypothetical protein
MVFKWFLNVLLIDGINYSFAMNMYCYFAIKVNFKSFNFNKETKTPNKSINQRRKYKFSIFHKF